jgi:hypothetical protein
MGYILPPSALKIELYPLIFIVDAEPTVHDWLTSHYLVPYKTPGLVFLLYKTAGLSQIGFAICQKPKHPPGPYFTREGV